MTRTASDQDLYRRLDQVAESLRQQQQGLLQGLFNPFVYPPCDYATTANVDLTAVFTSITDVAAGTSTLAAQGGMRILVWQQTNKVDNGIYEVGTDNYLHRVADMLVGATALSGARVFVRNGYAFGGRDFFVIGPNKVVGTGAMTISPPRGVSIFSTRLNGLGNGGGTSGWSASNNGQTIFDSATGALARITYTPPVNVELESYFHLRFTATQAAYAYVYPGFTLSPSDRDTQGQIYDLRMMHASVQTYEPFQIKKIWRLTAGVAYTLNLVFNCSGWSGSLTDNVQEFWMEANATVSGD